jgi:hypothetical protein
MFPGEESIIDGDAELGTLAEVMNSSEASAAARVAAANSILDLGWGKPTQPVSSDEGAAPVIITRIELVAAEFPPDHPAFDEAKS